MDDESIIKTANTILSQLTVPRRVHTIEDLNADMFITLYEGLCGESIPDLILPSRSEENEMHNMQCVIDSLALDVLHTSLAHIVGQDIIRGRRMSIINLLDIFSGLLEYILDGIEKEDSASEGAGQSEDSGSLDAANQTEISDAVRCGLTDSTNRLPAAAAASSDENTENLIALGDEEKYLKGTSPTASPHKKKSRKSGEGKSSERRRSKRITPHVVSQPVASSSMHSINPSGTESESDASTKPTAGKGAGFNKVPAEFSPQEPGCSKKDTTFTKPAIPSMRSSTRADKLAEQYLDTGESTRELIALGDTPVLKTKTRSATTAHSKPRAITVDKPSKGVTDANKSNNAQSTRPSKRSHTAAAVPKRHVSFMSDRTIGEDTLSDISTRHHLPGEELQGAARVSGSSDRHDISSRLADYFDRKEAASGDVKSRMQQNVRLSPLHDGGARPKTTATEAPGSDDVSDTPVTESEEYRTAIEKSASLYDRVRALRNAASEKLESIRSETAASQYDTAAEPPLSDHAQGQQELRSDATPATSRYTTARDPLSTAGRLPSTSYDQRSDFRTAATSSVGTSVYESARQSNVPDLSLRHSPRLRGDTTTEGFSTAPIGLTSDYRTARSHPAATDSIDAYRSVSAGDLATSTRRYLTAQERGGNSVNLTRQGDGLTAGRGKEDYATRTNHNDLRFITEETGPSTTSGSTTLPSRGYKRPDWRSKMAESESEKKVRFTRPSTRSVSKSKSQTMVEAVRKTLNDEKWRERIQHKLLSRQYKDDLTDMVEAHKERLEEEKTQARAQDKEFTANVQRLSEAYGDKSQRKPAPAPTKPKGFLLPKSRVMKKRAARRSRSLSPSASKPSKPLDPNDDDFLPNLMEEFPHLYLAPETIHKMWMDHQHQSAAINKRLEEDKKKQSKAKTTIEDAEKRQALLMNIMQKELDHTKRIKAMRDKENAEVESKRKQRDVRVQSARVKKYYDEYSTRMKSSMLKNKTKEEQLFKRLFAEGLKVQKERMQTLRGYAREQREVRARKQQVDVEALENFYKDQFSMLADSVAQERRNVEVRDAAQAEVLNKMKKGLRKKMEADIENFQEQLKRDEDDYYFRQLDAEKVVQQLNMARYQTGI